MSTTTTISNVTLINLLINAFRNSIGKNGWEVIECVSWLDGYWHILSDASKTGIKMRIRKEIEDGGAGDSNAVLEWEKILALPIRYEL